MLSINMDDVMQVVSNIQNYLIAFGVVLVLALLVMFAVRKMPKAKKKMIRAQSGLAILLALAIVINPIRIELRQSTEKHNIKDPYILEVVKYIDSHYSSDLTIESLLANIPLSRRNFEVKFKNAMNTSIYQYILNCRCNHLADLLLTTDRSLADLAIEVGFKDYNNISRVFKKYKGCSPLEYRQKKTSHI